MESLVLQSRDSSTSLSLLERAKNNDELAWERIVDLYAPLVYRMCRLSRISADDSRDVAQDVFRAAFRGIARFRRDRPGDSFRAWLQTITKHKILDYFRQRETHPPGVGGSDMQMQIHQLPDLSSESSTEGGRFDSDSNLMQRAIRLLQNDFAERTWQAFWMTTIEDREPADVAEELGMSLSSVYQAKSRVLRRIREELAGLTEGLP